MEQSHFITIAEKYKHMIYRVAFNYFGNTYDADDTVQDVLMKLYAYGDEFESSEHIRYWLIRVTVNACKNTLMMPWRRKHVAFEELPDSATFENEEQSELFMAVMELPEKYRSVLNLFYYEELPVRDISRLLKINESAVTTRLSRARKQLEIRLREVWQDE